MLSEAYGDKIHLHIYDNSVDGAPEITLKQLEAKGKPDHERIRESANYYLRHLREREEARSRSQGGVAGGGAKGEASQVDFDTPELYTGSAADYERPSLHYVGTGEGTQVYGWGLYASDRRDYAEMYAESQKNNKSRPVETRLFLDGRTADEYDADSDSRTHYILQDIERAGGVGAYEAELDGDIGRFRDKVERLVRLREERNAPGSALLFTAGDADRLRAAETSYRRAVREKEWLDAHRDGLEFREVGGPASEHLYEQTWFTDRAPGDESHLLKWYESVSDEQRRWIEKAIRERFKTVDFHGQEMAMPEGKFNVSDDGVSLDLLLGKGAYAGAQISGGSLYADMKKLLGSPRAASEFLARAGIDGVKYPANSYGGAVKDGDEAGWNYVSFRDDNIRVDHKWTDGEIQFDTPELSPEGRREYDAVVARYTNADGTKKPGWMKAPNGKPTKLMERQWVQVRTPAFRAWFGDWEGDPANASKVVDENGEPLVVYHATDNAFTVFDRSRLGENTDYNAYDEAAKRMSRLGFWFNESDLRKRTNTKLSVSAYVDIKNPYETTFDELWNAMSETSHEEFIEDLNGEGYDGITLEDAEFGGKSFVLLEPTQIKSATDNNGDFSGENADVNFDTLELAAESHSRSALADIAAGKPYGILHNPKYGVIRYPLGRAGKGGEGFLHIVEHRMNGGASLDDAIDIAIKVGKAAEIGEETLSRYNTHHLNSNGVRAIIAEMPDHTKVITGYEIDADEKAAANRRAAELAPPPHVSSEEVIAHLRGIVSQSAAGRNGVSAADDAGKLYN